MNPPGNYNGAFRLSTLLVDGATGEVLGEVPHAPRADDPMRFASGAPRADGSGPSCAAHLPLSAGEAEGDAACAAQSPSCSPRRSAWRGGRSRPQTALDEHGGPVKGLAVAADGARALTASFDYSLILWDLPKEAGIARLYGHEAAVNDVAFVPGGSARSASDDGTIGLWDLAAGSLMTRLEGPPRQGHRGRRRPRRPARRLGRLGPHRAGSGTWQRRQLTQLTGVDNLNAVRSRRGRRAPAPAASDGSVQILARRGRRPLAALNAHDFGVTALDWRATAGPP